MKIMLAAALALPLSVLAKSEPHTMKMRYTRQKGDREACEQRIRDAAKQLSAMCG